MKWKWAALILLVCSFVQLALLVDYHFRLVMANGNTTAWFDTATQWQITSESWELNTRKLATINYACTTKLHHYQELVTQMFDPRLQNEMPLKPLDLIEAPQK